MCDGFQAVRKAVDALERLALAAERDVCDEPLVAAMETACFEAACNEVVEAAAEVRAAPDVSAAAARTRPAPIRLSGYHGPSAYAIARRLVIELAGLIDNASNNRGNEHTARRLLRMPLAQALVFAMPDEYSTADMLRADLAAARAAWIDAGKAEPQEHLRREQSDFRLPVNHEGEVLDFHSLRHSCGAWLVMAGVHPNIIKTVMRHCKITLTMDTYGHLMPDDTADAIEKLPNMAAGQPEGLKLADVAG